MLRPEFGIFLPAGPEKGNVSKFMEDIERFAEQVRGSISSLWMSDHLFWGDNPTHEAWTVISFLAGQYAHFHIGTMVLGQGFRNPALLAKMGATLQTLSHGRLIVGMGAGWKEDEYHAYGLGDFPSAGERITQLEEAVIVMKRMWYDADPVSFSGRHYKIVNAYCQPKPHPVPPIMIGGTGQKTLRVVAQHANWWNCTAKTPAEYAGYLATLRETANRVGRDMDDIRLTWMGKLALARTESEAQALTVGHNEQIWLQGTPATVRERLQDFRRLGVSYIMFEILGLDRPETIPLLNEVLNGLD